jgi:glycosyltransferase involved in cell wall biosynthesis
MTVKLPQPMTPRVAIIDPVWTHYRYPVYCELAQHCRVDWIFSPAERAEGFGGITSPPTSALQYFEIPMRKPLGQKVGFWQVGLTRYLIRERPDVVMVSANPRSISFWLTLVAGRVLGVPVYAHGHGVLRRSRIPWAYRRMMNLLLRLCTGYIAYGAIVRNTFAARGFPVKKVQVAANSMINPCTASSDEKTGSERGLLFLGRLRADTGLEILLGAVEALRHRGHRVELHIIGEGEARRRLQELFPESDAVHWYGEIYDPARIREISRACFAGCHPGPAGLSVVHLMSLSLPVLVQEDVENHAPEVALIEDWNNGVRYGHGRPAANVENAITAMLRDPSKLRCMQNAACRSYVELVNPSLATRLGAILLQHHAPAFVPVREAAIALTIPPPGRAMDVPVEQPR